MKKLSLIVMSLSHMFIDIYNNVLPVLLPLFVLQFSLSYTQVGLVVALFSISSSLVQPIFGFISIAGGLTGFYLVGSWEYPYLPAFWGWHPTTPFFWWLSA